MPLWKHHDCNATLAITCGARGDSASIRSSRRCRNSRRLRSNGAGVFPVVALQWRPEGAAVVSVVLVEAQR